MTGANDIAWAINAASEETEKRTRRERIATACLQGLLAHGLRIDGRILAGSAVACADALIEALDADVRSAVEEDSGVQRMPPTLDELRVRLEQELAREPENRGDEGSWYSRQSWRANVLDLRAQIAELEGADPSEIRRLKRELEEARHVGD